MEESQQNLNKEPMRILWGKQQLPFKLIAISAHLHTSRHNSNNCVIFPTWPDVPNTHINRGCFFPGKDSELHAFFRFNCFVDGTICNTTLLGVGVEEFIIYIELHNKRNLVKYEL